MPRLAIVLLTYERTQYALEAIRSTLEGNTPESAIHGEAKEKVHVHIADSSSSPEHRFAILDSVTNMWDYVSAVTTSNVPSTLNGGGYGASMNAAWKVVSEQVPDHKYTLWLEDDWELFAALDLQGIMDDMDANGQLWGCTRLGHIGYTQPLRGTLVQPFGDQGGRHYLLFDPESPEPHVFAGGPRIEARWWTEQLGRWPEGIRPGDCEWQMCHRPESRRGVAYPVDMIHPYGSAYGHCGSTRSTDVGEWANK